MDLPDLAPSAAHHRGHRRHRFMESSDINAAFRELFGPLRSGIRRGLTVDGQLYALEMDPFVPGQLMGSDWLPPAVHGIDDEATLARPELRLSLFARLLGEERPESLFAYVCERWMVARRTPQLYVELASADGLFVAEYPIVKGRGWYARELGRGPHRRIA